MVEAAMSNTRFTMSCRWRVKFPSGDRISTVDGPQHGYDLI